MPSLVLAQTRIGTIERGVYQCELPGSAAGAVGIRQENEDFVILSSSRYRAEDGRGTYLRKGDVLTMTSGPRNGERYRIVSANYLRKIAEDGEPGRLRCIRVRR